MKMRRLDDSGTHKLNKLLKEELQGICLGNPFFGGGVRGDFLTWLSWVGIK